MLAIDDISSAITEPSSYAIDQNANTAQQVYLDGGVWMPAPGPLGTPFTLTSPDYTILNTKTVEGYYSPTSTTPSQSSGVTVNVVVTVEDDGTGNQNVFKLDGQIVTEFDLIEGVTYVFDQSDASNASNGTHPPLLRRRWFNTTRTVLLLLVLQAQREQYNNRGGTRCYDLVYTVVTIPGWVFKHHKTVYGLYGCFRLWDYA